MHAKVRPLAIVLVLATLAFAQDAGGDLKAPFNPYSTVKKGDWALHRMTISAEPGAPLLMLATVEETKDGEAIVRTTEKSRAGAPKSHDTTYTMGKEITVAALMDAKGKLEDVSFADEKKTVGGKEFTCKKLTCSMNRKRRMSADRAEDDTSGKLEAWLSADMKAGGLVAGRMTLHGPTGEVKIEVELVGYGSEGKTDWGQTLAEAEKADKAEKK